MKYEEFIKEHYNNIQATMGRCKQACEHMKSVFPELQITNGFVHLAFHGDPQTHWWCIDPEGNIVDPTAFQYQWNGTPIYEYEEITDEHDERRYEKTKCMNCGEYYYVKPELKGVMHNRQCEKEFVAYLNGEI